MKAYVTIGNSDGKLSHAGWQAFHEATRQALVDLGGECVGEWRRDVAPFVNACFCYDVDDVLGEALRADLARLARIFDQDTIGLAWCESELVPAEPKP